MEVFRPWWTLQGRGGFSHMLPQAPTKPDSFQGFPWTVRGFAWLRISRTWVISPPYYGVHI